MPKTPVQLISDIETDWAAAKVAAQAAQWFECTRRLMRVHRMAARLITKAARRATIPEPVTIPQEQMAHTIFMASQGVVEDEVFDWGEDIVR